MVENLFAILSARLFIKAAAIQCDFYLRQRLLDSFSALKPEGLREDFQREIKETEYAEELEERRPYNGKL